jgi:hypothetical protein
MMRSYAGLIGIILAIVALAQRLGGYENKPLALALTVLAAGLLLYAAISWVRERIARQEEGASIVPSIENFEVNNALNFRITNKRVKDGLADDVLILHSIKLWNPGRKQFEAIGFCSTDGTPVRMPIILTNDHPGLPYRTPRMFQLVEFSDRAAPFVQGYFGSDHRYVKFLLTYRGFWEFSMELRWAGGSTEIIRVFQWSERSLPKFCKPPS